MSGGRYRIGLVVGSSVRKWITDFAEWALAHPSIELAAIIGAPDSKKTRFDRLLAFEAQLLRKNCAYAAYAGQSPIPKLAGVTQVHLSPAWIGEGIADGSAGVLRDLELDAIVCSDSCDTLLALSRFAKDGMLSVAVGGGEKGSIAGLAEVVAGDPRTPFAVERVRDSRPPECLFTGSVSTRLFHGANYIGVQARAFACMRLVLERLASGAVCGEAITTSTLKRPAPSIAQYGSLCAKRSLAKGFRRAFGREFNWQVAVARQPWRDFQYDEATIVPNPPGAFLADPFVIEHEGSDYLFVEEFPFRSRKGVISAYALAGDKPERLGVVLEEPYHLSYPFVFEVEGELFMVPETGGDRSVRLYKTASFPTGWKLAKVLLKDVDAVDTILFRHGELWWMLTTMKGDGPALNNAELHAFYADHPLGEWTAHRQNPVVVDAMRGRNGGFVRDTDGTPCRVAQVPGFTVYGAGSEIYRIDEITPETYRESLVRRTPATFFPKLDGAHHLSGTASVTAFDFMRIERPRSR